MLQVDKRPISDQVLTYLRKKIMLQEFKEGEHLKETLLSEELNVSRGPIREAISKLEREGLVIRPSNGRAIVQKFGENDIRDLYESRILLENYALTTLKPEMLKENGHLLYEYLKQMEVVDGQGVNIDADIEFHYCLVKMTGNKALIRLWNSLNEIFKTLIEVTTEFTSTRQQEIIVEHKVIVDAIFENDIDKAQQFLRQHLEGASDYYSKAVFNLQGEEVEK